MSYKYKTNVTKNRNTKSGHKIRIAKHESRIRITNKDKYNKAKQNKNNKTDQNNTS